MVPPLTVPVLFRLIAVSSVPLLPTARVAPVLSSRPPSVMPPALVIVPMLAVANEPSSTSEVAFEIVPDWLLQEPSVPPLS